METSGRAPSNTDSVARSVAPRMSEEEASHMRKRVAMLAIALIGTVLATGPSVLAQRNSKMPKPGVEVPLVTPGPGWKACPRCMNDGHIATAREKANVDKRPFNRRDISGIWSGDLVDLGGNGTPIDVDTAPPFTPYGQKLYEATVSDAEWSSKDPRNFCDPTGFPRSYTYNYGIEFVQLPNRVIEFFEQGHTSRVIWTDGRKLPPNPPTPRFYGYAVGRWDGDTFIVESNGYDDRSWIMGENGKRNPQGRQGGFVHSDEMRVTETYKRLNYGLLETTITITDPKVYQGVWKSSPKQITLVPDSEMGEHVCVPSDEIDFNNRNILPALEKNAPGK